MDSSARVENARRYLQISSNRSGSWAWFPSSCDAYDARSRAPSPLLWLEWWRMWLLWDPPPPAWAELVVSASAARGERAMTAPRPIAANVLTIQMLPEPCVRSLPCGRRLRMREPGLPVHGRLCVLLKALSPCTSRRLRGDFCPVDDRLGGADRIAPAARATQEPFDETSSARRWRWPRRADNGGGTGALRRRRPDRRQGRRADRQVEGYRDLEPHPRTDRPHGLRARLSSMRASRRRAPISSQARSGSLTSISAASIPHTLTR